MGTGDIAREAKEARLLKAAEGHVARVGDAVMYLALCVEDPPGGDRWLKEIRIKVRYGEEGDVLVVVKAEGSEGNQVAFHSGDRVDDVVIGLANRLRNGSLKWREDKPYEQK